MVNICIYCTLSMMLHENNFKRSTLLPLYMYLCIILFKVHRDFRDKHYNSGDNMNACTQNLFRIHLYSIRPILCIALLYPCIALESDPKYFLFRQD